MAGYGLGLSLLGVILDLMRIVKADLTAGYDDCSVSVSQYRMLRGLMAGTATVTEVAAQNAVALPTATKSLDVLVERGWVERTRSDEDRRLVLVSLTPAGREAQLALQARAVASLEDLLDRTEPSTQATLGQALQGLRQALDGSRGESRGVSGDVVAR